MPALGHPAVAEVQHPVLGAGAVAAHQHRRVRSLDGLGPRPDRIEVNEAAVVLGRIFGPDPAHGVDPVGEQCHPGPWIGAVVAQFLAVPSGPHAEQEAPLGDAVQARHRLRGDDRVPL
jgi:hypothetical protein